jgi:hypothetical protein
MREAVGSPELGGQTGGQIGEPSDTASPWTAHRRGDGRTPARQRVFGLDQGFSLQGFIGFTASTPCQLETTNPAGWNQMLLWLLGESQPPLPQVIGRQHFSTTLADEVEPEHLRHTDRAAQKSTWVSKRAGSDSTHGSPSSDGHTLQDAG